ncbi:MAG: hypothetical protein LUQ71_04075 [Methanoregula sp.]|nr:hypothetical protein [Methanoregula sp.]
MKNKSLTSMIILMTCFIILSVGIAGCTSQAPSASSVPGINPSTIAPSEMALQPSDVPANFTFVESGERNLSEMSNWSLGHGWKKGYYAVYRMNNQSSRPGTLFEQYISVYSVENISLIVPDSLGNVKNWSAEDKNITFEMLPLPAIGDSSSALVISDTSDNTQWYRITFAKKDVYMEIWSNGTATDYETAGKLAETAAAKIK